MERAGGQGTQRIRDPQPGRRLAGELPLRRRGRRELDRVRRSRVVPLLARSGGRCRARRSGWSRAVRSSANSGILLTRVQHLKEGPGSRRFVICDGGMHSLLRPALYQAPSHFVWPTRSGSPRRIPGVAARTSGCRRTWSKSRHRRPDLRDWRLPGPRTRPFPEIDRPGRSASPSSRPAPTACPCASNYNDHGRPAEVLVDGDRAEVIGERQPQTSILAAECTTRRLDASALQTAESVGSS